MQKWEYMYVEIEVGSGIGSSGKDVVYCINGEIARGIKGKVKFSDPYKTVWETLNTLGQD